MVEITLRTIQGRFLFRPSERLNQIVAGCLSRAQKHTDAAVHAVVVLSNHLHLLGSFESVEQMAQFSCHLKTNLSKEVGRLHDWRGPMFADRYHSAAISEEPGVQLQRLRYLLSQGAKEGLVLSPRDWPGLHSAGALLEGEPIRGIWIDRTGLGKAREKDCDVPESAFTSDEELCLAPLPCLVELSPEKRRSVIRDMVEEIESETLARHRRQKTTPVGVREILRRKPDDRPKQPLEKSPQPKFHASRRVIKRFVEGFREFLLAYRFASDRLAAGDFGVRFPDNCYPPRLPFLRPALAHPG